MIGLLRRALLSFAHVPLGLVLCALAVLVSAAATRFAAVNAARAQGKPNVVIIVTDDQREGLNVMPDTRKWFGQGGTQFTRAYATTPQCCPSRASILTGRYAHNHGVTTNGGSGRLNQQTTLSYYLKQAGYTNALFGKYLNGWPLTTSPPHFHRWAFFQSMYPSYVGRDWNVDGRMQQIDQYPTRYIADRAIAFIESTPEPWFLYLAPPNPHAPYTAEPAYAQAAVGKWNGNPAVFETDRSDKPPYVRSGSYTYRDGQRVRARQLRTLMSVDDMVERVFSHLEAMGKLGNTLAFFISDNGFLWSEHGLAPQKAVPYTQATRVPFFARWPGHFPAGAKESRIVANIDIAPTVMRDALGVTPPTPMDGRSLLEPRARSRLLLEAWKSNNTSIPPWASMLTNGGQYVEYYDAGRVTFREYYDLGADPWQLNNLRRPPAGWATQLAADRRCAAGECP